MVRACRQGRTAKGPFSGKCGPAASALPVVVPPVVVGGNSAHVTHAELRGREKAARRPLNLPARSGFGQEPGDLVDAETNEQIALPRAEVAPDRTGIARTRAYVMESAVRRAAPTRGVLDDAIQNGDGRFGSLQALRTTGWRARGEPRDP